jgi:HAD superfamily hydrolase (TIGR01490 family)
MSRAPAPGHAAAFFDVDGTIVDGNVVRYYARIRTQTMPPPAQALWTACFALRVPGYVALDLASRARFQQALYREYRRFTPRELAERSRRHFERDLAPRLFPAALQRIGAHRNQGDHVVLVTGSLREIAAPLAVHVEATDLLAAELELVNGAYTGELAGGPLSGDRKARAVADYVARHGLDAARCHAYADSTDDVPMLAGVGHAHVVNPSGRLARAARRAGWEILRWKRA